MTELLVSLSGLSGDLGLAPGFTTALDDRGVPLTHLLRPVGASSELVEWIRGRLTRGDAMALHGYDHALRPLGRSRSRRGEFADLPHHEAGLRLTAARRALTVLGLRTDVFVPPRWLASDGTVEALAEQDFRVLADDTGIRDLRTGITTGSRVLGFRAAGEAWLLGAEVAWTVRRGGLVRINVRAKDLRRAGRAEAVLAAVDTALAHGVVPTTYRRTAGPRLAA